MTISHDFKCSLFYKDKFWFTIQPLYFDISRPQITLYRLLIPRGGEFLSQCLFTKNDQYHCFEGNSEFSLEIFFSSLISNSWEPSLNSFRFYR